MLSYILRRLIAAFFVVLGASFIVYILMVNSGDPLADTLQISDPVKRDQAVRAITLALQLDVNPIARYFNWLKGVGGCFIGSCDFGNSAVSGQPVAADLAGRVGSTLKLVTTAVVLSIVIGIIIGIVTALKQYSGFDYAVSFFTFLFFSLPVFWVAVLLKDLVAIDFNDFLVSGPTFAWWFIALLTLIAAGLGYSLSGGSLNRRLSIAGGALVVVGGVLYYVSATEWLSDPGLGPVVIALLSIGIAFGVTTLTAGLANQKALYTSLTVVVIGMAAWYPLQFLFYENFSVWKLLLLAVAAVVVGVGVGYAFGGNDKGLSARAGALTAFLMSAVVFIDRMMQAWRAYTENPDIRGRPIKTFGEQQNGLEGDFWIHSVDTFTHLILPTLALMLISLASYTRYSRASLLEVLNQDYIRTARAKGLTERTVIVRHAFRNALIPIATIIAFDIGGLLGGAVITESVFQWNAMGRLFQEGLTKLDPNPVMAFFVVVGVLAVIFNLLADLLYSALDPRIRVGS